MTALNSHLVYYLINIHQKIIQFNCFHSTVYSLPLNRIKLINSELSKSREKADSGVDFTTAITADKRKRFNRQRHGFCLLAIVAPIQVKTTY